MNLDYFLFRTINNLAYKNIYLDYFFIFSAKYLIWLLFIIVFSFLFLKAYKSKKEGINLFLKLGVSFSFVLIVNYFLSFLFYRFRPLVIHKVNQLIDTPLSLKSFPSDHAAVSFLFAFFVFFLNKKLGKILIVLASFISLGRVYAGVHYPFDILGGALIGLFLAWGISKVKIR